MSISLSSIAQNAYIEPIRPSSLSTIEPINHQAYHPLSPLTIEPINLWSSFATFKPFSLLDFATILIESKQAERIKNRKRRPEVDRLNGFEGH